MSKYDSLTVKVNRKVTIFRVSNVDGLILRADRKNWHYGVAAILIFLLLSSRVIGYLNKMCIGELFDRVFAVSRERIPISRKPNIDDGWRLYVPRRALLFQILRQINQVNRSCRKIFLKKCNLSGPVD